MKYQPLFGRVIIKDLAEHKKETVIITIEKPRYQRAAVLAVSADVPEVAVGDVVYYEGEAFSVDGGDYKIVKPGQIAFICIPCSAKTAE